MYQTNIVRELPEVIIINTAFNPEVAEFMQMLRGDSALDRTQIIFIGASSDERDMAFTLGANHFLYRPLKIDHLLDVVQ
jgi:PleD family two-component response regulator